MFTIGQRFRQARLAHPRSTSLRRFAEAMEMDHVHLTLIEKGQRLPNEELVRRLARVSGEDPADLVGVLWRDRLVAALRRELGTALRRETPAAPSIEAVSTTEGTESAVVARVVSALPDSGAAVPLPRFRAIVREALRAERGSAPHAEVATSIERMEAQGIVERSERDVRKLARHLQAADADDRFDLALDLAGVFAKGLTDKLFRGRDDTYVRHHFARVAPERIPEFQARLHAAIRDVVEDFDAGESPSGEQVQVLVSQVGDR